MEKTHLKGSVFVDSGAHSLYTKYVIDKGHANGYADYESDEFWKYVDDYAAFIKERQHLIDVYVNVDVIFNPELTWKVQMYLENVHKLKPLPVVHYNTDMKWLKKYMENHEYIGIGGTGQEVHPTEYIDFGDRVFRTISDDRGMPKHKLHGFAVTSPVLVTRYPWYSVDSTTWTWLGRYGAILLPRKKYGKWDYTRSPIVLFVSRRSSFKKLKGRHITTLSSMERAEVLKFIEEKGYTLGKSKIERMPLDRKLVACEEVLVKKHKDYKEVEVILEHGVATNGILRDSFNTLFYQGLADSMPPWPWPFKMKTIRGLL